MSVELIASVVLNGILNAPVDVDTEVFRFPATLDSGNRLIRLSLSGGILSPPSQPERPPSYPGGSPIPRMSTLEIPIYFKALGLVIPVPTNYFNDTYKDINTQAKGKIKFTGLPPGTPIFSNAWINRFGLAYQNLSGQIIVGSNGEVIIDARCNKSTAMGNCPPNDNFLMFSGPNQYTGKAESPGFTGGVDPPLSVPYIGASPIEFVTVINGGDKEIVISVHPVTAFNGPVLLPFCNTMDHPQSPGSSKYAWQAVLEDLGPV
jgi:hypothetical protein